jgi:hypothetical protein
LKGELLTFILGGGQAWLELATIFFSSLVGRSKPPENANAELDWPMKLLSSNHHKVVIYFPVISVLSDARHWKYDKSTDEYVFKGEYEYFLNIIWIS